MTTNTLPLRLEYANAVIKRRAMEEQVAGLAGFPAHVAQQLASHRVAALLRAQDEEQRLRDQLPGAA